MKPRLVVRSRASQIFSLAIVACFVFANSLGAGLRTGEVYALNFVDLNGRWLLTNDGHVTVVVLTTRADISRAQVVGARVPDYCLGDPEYRMITVVNFGRRYGTVARTIATSLIRHRINIEAAQLQRQYDARGIRKDAHRDVFVIADFEGTITQRLATRPDAAAFGVFVFGRDGELLRQWEDVPTGADLAAVVQ